MSLNVNTDVGIGSDVRLKSETPMVLTVAQGSSSDCGQEISWRSRSLFSVLTMVRKVVIGGAVEGEWHSFHVMGGMVSLRE